MFTMQSGQLENALRGGSGTDISAKQMVQSLTNCQQALEHRGPMAMTKVPQDNSFHFPSFSPASPSPNFYFPFYNRIVNVPPWQHVPWTPIPYPDFPQWQPIPYPDVPGVAPGQPADSAAVRDNAVVVAGPVASGPIDTPVVTAGDVNSQTITNEGDITNEGGLTNHGPVITHGPVTHLHTVTNHQTVINKKQVTNEGPVYNASVTNNNVVHSRTVHNHGDTHHHGDTFVKNIFIEEVIRWVGPMWAGDGTGGYEGPLYGIDVDLVTDVTWDGTDLKKVYRNVKLVGSLGSTQEEVIVSGTSCPETPLNATASNFGDIP